MDKQEVVKAIESFEEIISFLEGDGNLKHAEVLVAVAKAYVSASETIPKRFEDVVVSKKYPLEFYEGYNECIEEVTPIVARLKMENEELRKEYDTILWVANERSKVIAMQQESIAALQKGIDGLKRS